ncbi:Pentatricopeptide repeat-containing protein PNM1, mitochondrial [Linum perenne]
MPPSSSSSLQLRRILRYCLSSHSSHTRSPPPPATHLTKSHSLSRYFSSQSSTSATSTPDVDPVALSLSAELVKDPGVDSLPTPQRLHLSFSHIAGSITPSLISQTLNLAPDAGRGVLGFHQWLVSNPDFKHTDETVSFFVDYFGRRKDFKATDELLADAKSVVGPRTFESILDRLVRAGRPKQVVELFEKIEADYGIKRDRESLTLVVRKLCEHGHSNYAEKMVKSLANEIFPDEVICDMLIKGWCVDGKLDEAKRLAGEMFRGGFELSVVSYNALLDCVCKLCRAKEPFRMQSEIEKVLVEMDVRGVPRDVETFNVLFTNMCKLRRTQDAMDLFHRMGEWGCYPNETSFLVLIKSLYQAARVGEGDEMIDRMKSAGFGDKLDTKAYYGFLKILCGIERIEHAMTVFEMMKADGCKPGLKTYELLMEKWCAHNRIDKANSLYNEALSNGVPVTPKEYKIDPRYLPKPKAVKKGKKRETLPEKTARKKRRLKQIRLSFVKKPKKGMRRAY